MFNNPKVGRKGETEGKNSEGTDRKQIIEW